MAELTGMQNIGKEIAQRLKDINICSAEQLRLTGSKEAFRCLKEHDSTACLMLLYSLEGAIENIPYSKLSDEVKRDMKSFYNSLK